MPTWSDALLHPDLRRDPGVLSRARLTVGLSLVLVALAVGYALFYALVVRWGAGATIIGAGAAAAVVVLLLLRMRPWLRGSGQMLTGVLYLVLVALVCVEGGLDSLATPWLLTPPIFAILLLGRRSAAAWSALGVATVVALHVLESRGVRFAVAYPAAWTARLTLGSYAGLIVCTAVLMFVFEGIRAGAQARAESASAELARLAYRDALTGLANRARFVECLARALERSPSPDAPSHVAVLLLDLDEFKAVNDTMGHAAGDALLVQVAQRLLSATRGCDTVARLGGDEFAVVLDGVRHDEDLRIVAERIVSAVGAPYALATGEARVGASVGVAHACGAPESALHDADVAMYRAKALGRGRWVLHAPGMAPAVAAGTGAPAVPLTLVRGTA